MEEIVELVRRSLLPFTNNNLYFIDKIDCCPGCFGNIVIQLSSLYRANVEIIRDRNKMICSISTGTGSSLIGVKEYIDDVFTEYGKPLEMPSEDSDIIDYIQKIAVIILDNEEMMIDLKQKCKFRKISKSIWKKKKRYFNI